MRFGFFLGEALGSLRRNWVITLAAVLTVFISMAILGLVLVSQENLNTGVTSLKNRVRIEIFIKDDASAGQTADLEARIKNMREVKNYEYVSKEQALKEFSQRLGDRADEILANLTENPLPASYRVYVKDANQVDRVAKRFFNDAAVGSPDDVSYARATVRKMLATIGVVTKGMWAATGLFGVASVLLISTTVRLSIFARRNEIEIMRLVGATNWFIRWPFMLEGFVTGLIGSLVAVAGVWLANWTVFNWVTNSNLEFLDVQMYPLWYHDATWPLGLLPTLVILGAVLGAFGSLIALRRYLRT